MLMALAFVNARITGTTSEMYDFVMDRTHAGKRYRMLTILDEYSSECLVIKVARKLNSTDVINTIMDLFVLDDIPDYIRSDNGPVFTTELVKKWFRTLNVKA